jgi:hypothetical protein
MQRRATQKYVILTPKTEKGTQRLGNHGTKWVFRGVGEMKFVRTNGPIIRVMSLNGDSILCIQEREDVDFEWRHCQ